VSAYGEEFFELLREGSKRSAAVIVPLVWELIEPRSVVDVGCGIGAWLAAFARHGVEDYLGVDGFVPAGLLEIPADRFVEADLTGPLVLGREFDLAVSLEVAEHLPESAAAGFVVSLTRLAPVVLFSAAIPGQGGTEHVNEQWPEYWSRLFGENEYDAVDILRPLVWHDERVEVWYAQNTILYVTRRRRDRFPLLQRTPLTTDTPLAMVHPQLFTERVRALDRLSEALTAERESTRLLAAGAEQLQAEVRRYRVMSEPRNMSLRRYLGALPAVTRGALLRRFGLGEGPAG
jgi:SAM-dependent methyltransferase